MVYARKDIVDLEDLMSVQDPKNVSKDTVLQEYVMKMENVEEEIENVWRVNAGTSHHVNTKRIAKPLVIYVIFQLGMKKLHFHLDLLLTNFVDQTINMKL